ncbi:MAG: hypothetical protein ACW97Z_16300 [Candidatus Hodarchaeales archaeon]
MIIPNKEFLSRLSSVLFLLFLVFLTPFNIEAGNTSFNVESEDQWTYKIIVAKRTFSYSIGIFSSDISTRGYSLKEEVIPAGESINLTIISIKDENPVSIVYRLNSNKSMVEVESNESQIILGIQNALGLSVLGEEISFFDNSSGVAAGEDFFVIPSTMPWLSIFNIWNQTIPELDGTLEGIEAVLYLDYEDTKKYFFMELEYSGSMNNKSSGIVLDFVYAAEFKWEKKNGVLLFYDIDSDMEGTVNNSYSAGFSLDIRIEREEEVEKISSMDIVPIFGALLLVSFLVMRKKKEN